MRTRVKICGLTRKNDVELAVALGADALGFIFADSHRKVGPEFVCSLRNDIPAFVTVVGVFVNADIEKVKEIYKTCRLDIIQLHGSEDEKYVRKLGLPHVKAFRASSKNLFSEIMTSGERIFLLDSCMENSFGGTGQTFDWEIARKASEYGRVILAGGLTPDNILQAVEGVKPYAVDISSGIETEPGIKSELKMRKLFEELQCK